MADNSYRSNANEEDENEEEEEIDETSYKAVKDAVLFAIDVSSSMLRPTGIDDPKAKEKDSATLAALKCAYALMQQRIISHPNDMMGILLFGTQESKFRDDDPNSPLGTPYPHCYLLSELDVPSASDVKRLRSMVEDENEATKLLKPAKDQVSMANILFCANQVFTSRAPNFSSRRLFLVTDNDDPHKASKELRTSAIVRAKDLYDLGVIIELFPISSPGRQFDRGLFYDDIVYRPPLDSEAPASISTSTKAAIGEGGISLLASLLSNIMSRAPPKRALFSNLALELGPEVRISVKGYIIFKRQEAKRSCYVWLDGEVPKIAEGTTSRQQADVGTSVPKERIKKAFRFGGDHVLFSPEELNSLRHFDDPVIRIVGFKPLSMLPFWACVRPSTFIYPSEEGYIGSTRTFSALQQIMIEKERFALVWFVARKNATPVLAALYPGAETKNPKTGEQEMPPGLWVCPLPYADDIRQNPDMMQVIRAPDILKDKMRDVVLNLQLPGARYDPSRYPNPSLQWHYTVLQAMALEEDLPEKPDDKTIPKYRQIDKRVGQDVIDWGIELEKQIQEYRQEHGILSRGGPSKRGGGLLEESKASKKPKSDSSSEPPGDEEMKKHFKKNTVSKLTVPILKGWLQSKNLSVSGKKDELVSRVEEHFENKMDLD